MTLNRFQVLVVEDNKSARELVGEMLEVLGHDAVCVPSAEDALDSLKSAKFDVLLADISLPGMSGIELAERIVKDIPSIRVVFASGFGYLVADKTDFDFQLLRKPYGMEQLKHALDPNC